MSPAGSRAATSGGGTRRREARSVACSWRHEDELVASGSRLVAGVDEVGRGALCGPVLAGAVVLPRDFDVTGVDDSKRLTPRQREVLSARIRAGAVAWAIGRAEADEIDRVNILRATHLAMRRALDALAVRPDIALVDGRPADGLGVPQRAIVGGDRLSVSIAAASIVAKVERDAWMCACDEHYPGYGLARNMGYGSEEHREALDRLGPTRIHRRSFGVAQRWLF